MGTTPNYGWTYPPATNYVKDLPTNLGDLADEIDASLYTVATTPAGVETVLASGTLTGTTGTINLSNVLSNTYSYYTLNWVFSGASAQSLYIRFRENTTDKATGYNQAAIRINNAGATAGWASGAVNQMHISDVTNGVYSTGTVNIMRIDATQGSAVWSGFDEYNGYTQIGGTRNGSMTNFTGLSLFSSVNLTGNYILTGRKP